MTSKTPKNQDIIDQRKDTLKPSQELETLFGSKKSCKKHRKSVFAAELNKMKKSVSIHPHLNLILKQLKQDEKKLLKSTHQFSTKHLLSQSLFMSKPRQNRKVKSIYAEYFNRSRVSKQTSKNSKAKSRRKSYMCNKKSEIDSKGKSSEDVLKRQFTIDQPKIYNPVLKSMKTMTSNDGGVSLGTKYTLLD